VAIYRIGGGSVGAGDDESSGHGILLEQNYPNPFAPATTIRFALPSRAEVRLGVYDVAGREIAVLEDGVFAAGPHEVRWEGLGGGGMPLAAGVYFLRLDAAGETRKAKILLAR
jgi:hypothetical protein